MASSLKVPCIKCGEAGYVGVDIETTNMTCGSCDNEYTVDDVKSTLAAWSVIVPWLLSHPSKPAPVGPIN